MRRQGFTLVEMLVSLALVLFIMVILSQALTTGLETFRQLKATGELEEKLRMASTILRQDLKLDHFEGKRRLSDPSFWTQGPPREGFFHIEQLTKSQLEGRDGDQLPSWAATTHRLHFSIKLRGSQREDFLSALIPANSPLFTANTTYFAYPPDARYQEPPPAGAATAPYNSQWAEVVYFLWPNGSSASGTPLYGLYRRQRLAVPNNYDMNWGNSRIPLAKPADLTQALTAYSAMSCAKAKPGVSYPDSLYFNSPTDLTVPERRYGMNRVAPDQRNPSNTILVSGFTPLGTGEDLLLTDVVSFAVRVLSPDMLNRDDPSDIPNAFVDLPQATSFGGMAGNNLVTPIGVFDTWSSVQDEVYSYHGPSAPLPIRISLLQILLRIYDVKTQQTRQITIVQDL